MRTTTTIYNILTNARRGAFRLIYAQIILVLLVTCMYWLSYRNSSHAIEFLWSTLLGGVVWILPSCFFVFYCINKRTLLSPVAALRQLYVAEFIKFLLSGILLVLCVKFLLLQPIPFLSGYAVAVLAQFFLMLIFPRIL